MARGPTVVSLIPTGIATQDQQKMKVLDADAAATRVENYLRTLIHETEMLARSCGYQSPDQLQPKDALVQVEPGRWVTIDTIMQTL